MTCIPHNKESADDEKWSMWWRHEGGEWVRYFCLNLVAALSRTPCVCVFWRLINTGGDSVRHNQREKTNEAFWKQTAWLRLGGVRGRNSGVDIMGHKVMCEQLPGMYFLNKAFFCGCKESSASAGREFVWAELSSALPLTTWCAPSGSTH